MSGSRRLHLASIRLDASAFLLGLLLFVNAAPVQAETLSSRLPQLCAHLQKQGWTAPADIGNSQRTSPAEINVPGIMYLCNVEHRLGGNGPGRPPELQALLSNSDHQPSIIFSASVWCETDREAALKSLAEEIEKELASIAMHAPAETLAATRKGLASTTSANELRFTATPINVDAQACSKVQAGMLGAVLMKIDVVIEPASNRRR
jgi:hypothetical protein